MNKVLTYALATCVVLLLVFGSLWQHEVKSGAAQREQLSTAEKALSRAAEQRKRDAATLVARQAVIASQGRKLAEAQQGLSQALQGEKAWSDTSVPESVRSALLRDSGGSKSAAN